MQQSVVSNISFLHSSLPPPPVLLHLLLLFLIELELHVLPYGIRSPQGEVCRVFAMSKRVQKQYKWHCIPPPPPPPPYLCFRFPLSLFRFFFRFRFAVSFYCLLLLFLKSFLGVSLTMYCSVNHVSQDLTTILY